MSDRVRVKLTATLYHGKRKVGYEQATVYMTDDSSKCMRTAVKAFAKALSCENQEKSGLGHD